MRFVPASLFYPALLAWHFLLSPWASSLHAADVVTIHLQSGRSFTGFVDPQTSQDELVLRFEAGGMAIWRPIDWSRIVSAEHNGTVLVGTQLRDLADTIQSTVAEDVPPPPAEVLPNEPANELSRQEVTPFVQQASASSPLETALQRVQSIEVRAELANWNGGVEMDGLVLTVWPLDANGQVLPVAGTVQVELVGFRPSSASSSYSYARGNPFQPLAQWARSVQAADMTTSGLQFQLPFQAIHPEFDTDFGPYGMVQVRMAIPGHGTYSATASLVRIRPFSPLRDVREQLHLRRFFPQEQLTRTQ